MIYFGRYLHNKLIKMLILHYDKLIGKIEEHQVKIYLMVDNYMIDRVFDKDWKNNRHWKKKFMILTRIVINTDHKLPNNVTLKTVLILMTCVIKDDY